MAYQSDSDGGSSWVFIGKYSDSDTTSDVIPFDTGLPEEEEEESKNDDLLVGSAWRNQNEIVSDSDIEACSKDSEESDNETDVYVLQATARMSESKHEHIMEKSDEDSSSLASHAILKAMFLSSEDNLQENVEDTESEVCSTDDDRTTDPQDSNCDDSVTEDMISQEEDNVSLNDVIIQSASIDFETRPTFKEDESPPLSSVSSHSDFERIASSSDLVTSDPTTEPETLPNYTSNMVLAMPECTEETAEPNAVEDLSHSDGSEAGSSSSADFTIISTHEPVEVMPHQTETRQLTEDDRLPTNREKIDMAAGLDEACQQRHVGLVTGHASPPNHRLLISIIMISYGVGFLLGRCPIPSSTIALPYKDNDAPTDKTDIEEIPRSVKPIYHSANTLRSGSSEPATPLLTSPNKQDNGNTVARHRLVSVDSKLRIRNKRLRTIIRKLRSRNERIVMEQSVPHTAANDTTMAWSKLKHSCLKQQRISEFKMANKERKLQRIMAQLEDTKHDNDILNERIALSKILQAQHFDYLDLQQITAKLNDLEKSRLTERLSGVKLRLRRYRRDSKGLIQKLLRAKNRNLYLEMLVQQNDILKQPRDTESPLTRDAASPLLKAITSHSQTCHSGTMAQMLIKWLKSKVKGQRALVGKLEQEEKSKSMALEMLYNFMGELRNNAICLKRQIQILPLERARDTSAICRSIPKDVRTKFELPQPNSLPRCSYPINETLAVDFSYMNITLKPLSNGLHAYELKLLSDKVKPTLVFNSTLPMTSMCDLTLNTNLSHLVPMVLYTRMVKRNALVQLCLEGRVAGFSDLQKVCKSNNQSVDLSRKDRKNVENQLVVATNELEQLKQEKKGLNRKLVNATTELKKKSSMKNCLKSALNADELMNKVNSSKAYKAASKIAKKVKKTGRKAWTKFQKFVKKFGSSEYHDDFNDDESKTHHDDHKAQEFHEKRKHPRDFEEGNNRNAIEKHDNMVKKAEQKPVHRHLMPIYDKWQKVYCKVEKEVPQKSFTEIWESLGELSNENRPTTMAQVYRKVEKEVPQKSFTEIWESLGALANEKRSATMTQDKNITELVNPSVEIPQKVELPAWENHGNNDEWFLKIFEERARLRFKNSEDKSNWYLKMLEAHQATGVEYETWGNGERYENMFEDRKNIRDYHDEAQWYHMMAAERKTAREMSSSDRDGPSEEYCQA